MLHSVVLQTSLLQLLILAAGATSEDCYLCLVIEKDGDQILTNSSACDVAKNSNSSVNPILQRFSSLQSALVMIAGLEAELLSSPPETLEKCVTVHISTGHHVITAPVDFGNASVKFLGSKGAAGSPTLHCNYTVEVDLKRILDPGYFDVDYTMKFVGSKYVSFDDVEFIGCPYPLRLERVRTVAIHSSTFQ